jgi:hypothetical protein
MNDIDFDGGPAFPHEDSGSIAFRPGLTKRELFAVILMHGELVTCGVPGEAADALVEASHAAGDEVVDHMAGNAVENADALLRALCAPKQPVPRFDYDAGAASSAEKEAIKQLADASYFDALPQDTRDFVRHAAHRIQMEDDGIPF